MYTNIDTLVENKQRPNYGALNYKAASPVKKAPRQVENPFKDYSAQQSGDIEIYEPTIVKEKRVRQESESTRAVKAMEAEKASFEQGLALKEQIADAKVHSMLG